LIFGAIMQPIRTVNEAPAGTIDITTPAARRLIGDAAWQGVARRPPTGSA